MNAITSPDYSNKSANKNPIISRPSSGIDAYLQGQLRTDAFVSLRRFIMNWKTILAAGAILISGTLLVVTPSALAQDSPELVGR